MKQMHDGYFITSCGRVWSYKSNKFLSPVKVGRGYLAVNMSENGKHTKNYIHRLVAETYLDNPNNYDTVDHIDNDKTNNCVNNLQWMSREDNTIKGNIGSKKAAKQIRCVETGQIFESYTQAAKNIGVSCVSISNCVRGKTKTCGGLHWEVIE